MNEQQSEHAARILSVMANPARLGMLRLLVREETPVSAICEHVGLSQSAVSQHLATLRAQKLVSTRRDAQTIYYSSDASEVLALINVLDELELFRHRNDDPQLSRAYKRRIRPSNI